MGSSFPSSFVLTISKEAWLKDVWDSSVQGEGGWSPYFSKLLNDWGVGSAERFLSHLHGLRVYRDDEDRVLWTETKDDKLTMKSLYTALELRTLIFFPWSTIWEVWVQPKVSFFAWEATWGKVLTLDLVQKRGRSLVNRCFLCHIEEESIGHLFVHCVKTRVLWKLPFALFKVSWVLPSSVRKTLLGWHGSFVGNKRRKVWRADSLCLFWTIWKIKNRTAFNELSIQSLKSSFICLLWSEAKLFINNIPSTLFSFFD